MDYTTLILIVAASLSSTGGIIFGLYSDKIFSVGSILKREKKKNEINNSNIQNGEDDGVGNEDERNKISIAANNNNNNNNNLNDPILQQTKNIHLLEDNIKLYKFEKDLASSAIERILTAAKNKTIDNFEKDRLLLKYRDQLNKLNNKMEKIQSEIDVTKLIDLRNDLASLLDNKISDIDEKIKEINIKLGFQTYQIDLRNLKKRNNKKRNDDDTTTTISNLNKNLNTSTLHKNTIEDAIDANLKSKQVISYKISKKNRQKENLVNEERKKISDLKLGVLDALQRLDKAKYVKEEIEKEVLAIQDNQIKPSDLIDVDKENVLVQRQNVYTSEDKSYLGGPPTSTITTTTTTKNNNTFPKIFNSLKKIQSHDNSSNSILSTSVAMNPILENTTGDKDKIIETNRGGNLNQKEKFDFTIKENAKKVDNQIKNTPLFKALHYSELKTDADTKSTSFTITNEDKIKSLETRSSISDNQNKKIKFSFRSIFSRRKREKEGEEKGKKDYSISNRDTSSRKDSLSNILSKRRK